MLNCSITQEPHSSYILAEFLQRAERSVVTRVYIEWPQIITVCLITIEQRYPVLAEGKEEEKIADLSSRPFSVIHSVMAGCKVARFRLGS